MEVSTMIDEDYLSLKAFVESLPKEDYSVEHVFCDKRNKVVLVDVDGRKFVVKRYKTPIWLNRVVYTLFRKSKGERAFLYAKRLIDMGEETANPVACVKVKTGGLFSHDYFVSEYLPYPRLSDVLASETEEERKAVLDAFIDFLLRLHYQKIYQADNNLGNYLVHKVDGEYHFAMVDINRMEFGKVPSLKKAMRAFDQMGLSVVDYAPFIREYVRRRNMVEEEGIFYMLLSRKVQSRKKKTKKVFKGALHLA